MDRTVSLTKEKCAYRTVRLSRGGSVVKCGRHVCAVKLSKQGDNARRIPVVLKDEAFQRRTVGQSAFQASYGLSRRSSFSSLRALLSNL
uniref:Uncharacterized protein n=1 Tax=Rhipicephalus zambeziensis TaxID=60191 RepID=A0A224YH51_9ACAR